MQIQFKSDLTTENFESEILNFITLVNKLAGAKGAPSPILSMEGGIIKFKDNDVAGAKKNSSEKLSGFNIKAQSEQPDVMANGVRTVAKFALRKHKLTRHIETGGLNNTILICAN